MTRRSQRVCLSIVASAATIYYLTPPLLSWADPDEVRINDPFGPDNTDGPPGDPNEPVGWDDDDGVLTHWGKTDKAMRDPVVAALIVGNCPLLFAAWSDWSLFFDMDLETYSTEYTVGFARSIDLGATFKINGVHTHDLARGRSRDGGAAPGALSPPTGTPWAGKWLKRQRHPSVAAGADGVIYMVGEDYSREGYYPNFTYRSCIWLARSADEGLTWDVKAVVAAEGTQQNDEFTYPTVCIDTSSTIASSTTLYVVWTRNDASGLTISLARSENGGATFETPETVADDPVGFSQDWLASSAALGANGTLYVIWFEQYFDGGGPPRPDRYKMRRRFSNGQYSDIATLVEVQGLSPSSAPFQSCEVSSFGPEDDEPLYRDRASIAVGKGEAVCRRDHVYVAYVHDDYVTPPGWFDLSDANVYVIASWDAGESWQAPVRVHDAPAEPSGHNVQRFGYPSQFMPAIATSDAGHVGVAFLDRREDIIGDTTPLISNQAYKQYFTYSVDWGRTYVVESAVDDPNSFSLPRTTDDPNDTSFCYYGTRVGMTEWSGMTGYGRTFHPAWMSLRNWAGPPDPNPPSYWRNYRYDTRKLVGDIHTVRVEVLDAVPPDFEPDCDVDLSDFTQFQLCFGGSNNPPAPTCPEGVDADLDHDGDVDLSDFLIFQQCFTGSFGGCVGDPAVCTPGSEGGEGAGPQGMSPEPEFPSGPEPTPEELRQTLEAWCRLNGIPFT